MRPRLGITLGDVAGVGPEIVVRALTARETQDLCRPVIFGHPRIVERACRLVGSDWPVEQIETPGGATDDRRLWCLNPDGDAALAVPAAAVDPRAGQAAYAYLTAAAAAAIAGEIDGIVTAPLNKAALHLAGHSHPGHTEILAAACGVREFAMMLYLPPGDVVAGPFGLGIGHVTLHASLASVPTLLSRGGIEGTIRLVGDFLRRVGCERPRIGVCALNPHAGEDGLFGDEESRLIAPAVAAAQHAAETVSGPWPADTLIKRAVAGEFDGLVAMYHDQTHIPVKLIAFHRAVNVTLGLPIVRTSPTQGTAFDIAWQGRADPRGMIEAIRTAARLAPTAGARVP